MQLAWTTTLAPEMQACIDDCLHCHEQCLRDAMNYCLERGGEHMGADHFRLMMNCTEMCRTAAHFLLSSSSLDDRACAACADVCDACARCCEALDGMTQCAAACHRAGASCRQVSAGAGGGQGLQGSGRLAGGPPVPTRT